MTIEYDPQRDLLYVRIAQMPGPVVDTRTIAPGVFGDFDDQSRLVGIEVLEARQLLGADFQLRMRLFDPTPAAV